MDVIEVTIVVGATGLFTTTVVDEDADTICVETGMVVVKVDAGRVVDGGIVTVVGVDRTDVDTVTDA